MPSVWRSRLRDETGERIHVSLQQCNDADDGSQNDAMPDDSLEDVRLPADLVGCGGGHADALGVDHLAHDATGAVGGTDQHLQLLFVDCRDSGRVLIEDFCCSDMLAAAV